MLQEEPCAPAGPHSPSVPSRPGCPSFPGSPGMQGSVAVFARQVLNFAASVLRYMVMKQAKATRSWRVKGGIFSGGPGLSQMVHCEASTSVNYTVTALFFFPVVV